MAEGVAVITGGSRGIGAATAQVLAARGWDIGLSYRDDEVAARHVVTACEALGRRALAIQADVAVEADVTRLFEAVDRQLGSLLVLVNNAGIVGHQSRVDEMSRARLDRMFAVNVIGLIQCTQEAVRRMSTRYAGHGGAIVNVSSIATRIGSPGEYVDYAASKAAVDALTLGLSKEVAAEGIRVNAVRPGIINTEIHASGGQPDRPERLKGQIPMGRAGAAEEVAYAIAWLCSAEASYVTGATLDVGGGR